MNLNQVTIASVDVEKSTEFYKTLGLNLIVDSLLRYSEPKLPNDNLDF